MPRSLSRRSTLRPKYAVARGGPSACARPGVIRGETKAADVVGLYLEPAERAVANIAAATPCHKRAPVMSNPSRRSPKMRMGKIGRTDMVAAKTSEAAGPVRVGGPAAVKSFEPPARGPPGHGDHNTGSRFSRSQRRDREYGGRHDTDDDSNQRCLRCEGDETSELRSGGQARPIACLAARSRCGGYSRLRDREPMGCPYACPIRIPITRMN